MRECTKGRKTGPAVKRADAYNYCSGFSNSDAKRRRFGRGDGEKKKRLLAVERRLSAKISMKATLIEGELERKSSTKINIATLKKKRGMPTTCCGLGPKNPVESESGT